MADPTITSHHGIAPRAEDSATVNITLDGKEIAVGAGQFLIKAAEDAGVYVPRFCYHPRMKPVGMCRMCLVEVSGPRGATLQPACYVPVAEGMVVDTDSEKVHKAQDGVLEFLLVNHPLDCPVCDKGGECPLQDQTLAYGPGESRFVEEKRHFAKPIALSPLVLLDRERCIQCGRCTRFANEIAGEAMIDFAGRGDQIEVGIAKGHVFSSAFSGNTVQICPVGALTSTPYRFTARPWDLDQVESTCTTCAVGCRVAVQSSANRVTRLLGIDSDPVNQSWLCDKGRYGYEAVDSDTRITVPQIRSGGRTETASWSEALRRAADGLASIRSTHGAGAIGVIGGARLTNEDAYAWAKFAKGVIGTDSVDAQLGDGLPAELVLGLPRATMDEACGARCVIVVSGDLYDELPVLYLRLRGAAEESGLSIVELSPKETHLTPSAAAHLSTAPGGARAMVKALVDGNPPSGTGGSSDAFGTALQAVRGAGEGGEGIVVVLGRGSVAESGAVVAEAARVLADAYPKAKFLPALRRGNVMGALDMGLAPGLLPGRVTLESARDWFGSEPGWSAIPAERGHDTEGILGALVDHEMRAVVLVGADPLGDFPDFGLASRALEAAELVVAVDCLNSPSVAHADVVLPVAMHHERQGTTTNIEGRILRVGQKLTPPVGCWSDWMVASELASRLGSDLGVSSTVELWDEIERLAPSHSGLTRAVLESAAARDGVVVPLRSERVTIGRRSGRIDPMATPGIESVESQGPILRAGTSEPQGGVPFDESPAPARATRPALVSAGAAVTASIDAPAPADGALRLHAPRSLYDHGVQMLACGALCGLVDALEARVDPAELESRGLSSGDSVRLSSGDDTLVLEVSADPRVMPGVIEVAANIRASRGGDVSVATLTKAGAAVNDVRMEKA